MRRPACRTATTESSRPIAASDVMLANPEELRGAARALRQTCAVIQEDRAHLRQAGTIFERWRSPAADEFRSFHDNTALNSVGFVEEDLLDLAQMLERAAAHLEECRRRISRHESRVRAWFASQAAPADGSPQPWEREHWRYRPSRLPPSGDSEWLTAAAYLSRRGVSV